MARPAAVISGIANYEIAGVFARFVDVKGDGNGCRHLTTIGGFDSEGKVLQ